MKIEHRIFDFHGVYFRDSGLLDALLDIRDLPQLFAHPLSGASWEGFALE
jgi:hypothetical protein